MDIENAVLKEWYSAVQVANDHLNNCKINEFKIKHPVEYAYISRFFRLRTELRNDIECLLSLGPVQWFTLTYDEEHGRYHVHGFGVYRIGKGFDDFREWNSRQSIRTIQDLEGAKKGAKYLTKYAVKDAPRLRRSKTLVDYKKSFKRAKTLKKYGFAGCYTCHLMVAKLKLNKKDVINGLFNAPVLTY